MDFQITWTDYASNNLRSIFDHIAKDNPIAAADTVNDIERRAQKLRSVPFLGAAYSRSTDPRVREFIVGKYRLLYRVLEEIKTVEILMVWHSARREPRI
jgi:plasmid stabilization system protein ParE